MTERIEDLPDDEITEEKILQNSTFEFEESVSYSKLGGKFKEYILWLNMNDGRLLKSICPDNKEETIEFCKKELIQRAVTGYRNIKLRRSKMTEQKMTEQFDNLLVGKLNEKRILKNGILRILGLPEQAILTLEMNDHMVFQRCMNEMTYNEAYRQLMLRAETYYFQVQRTIQYFNQEKQGE